MRSSTRPTQIPYPRNNPTFLANIDAAFLAGPATSFVAFETRTARFGLSVADRIASAIIWIALFFVSWAESFAIAEADALQALEFGGVFRDKSVEKGVGQGGIVEVEEAKIMHRQVEDLVLEKSSMRSNMIYVYRAARLKKALTWMIRSGFSLPPGKRKKILEVFWTAHSYR